MQDKNATHQPGTAGKGIAPGLKKRKKSSITREKILAAAEKVFGTYPYHQASYRMIGMEAGIEHPLINYYFPSKSELFRAVIIDIQSQRTVLQDQWFSEIKRMDPARGLSVHLDNVLDHYHKHPDGYRIIALNMIQTTAIEQVPAFEILQLCLAEDMLHFAERLKPPVPPHEIEMFTRSFSTLLINYLGLASCYAAMLNLDPDSIQYLNWVKDTITYALLPRLEKMFQKG